MAFKCYDLLRMHRPPLYISVDGVRDDFLFTICNSVVFLLEGQTVGIVCLRLQVLSEQIA